MRNPKEGLTGDFMWNQEGLLRGGEGLAGREDEQGTCQLIWWPDIRSLVVGLFIDIVSIT